MKKIMCLVCTVALLVATLSMAGCMGSFFEEEELMIASVEHELLESGLTKIIITYTDDTVEPSIFYLPKGDAGETGQTGNGIKEISYVHNDVERRTDVTVYYTGEGISPVSFSVPDGLSVTGIEEGVDVISGEKYIAFRYSNGTTSPDILLPKGDKGADGNGIASFNAVQNDDRSITVTVSFTQGEPVVFTIPAPLDGEDGNGIEDMELKESNGKYYLKVTYTHGDPIQLQFARPTQWFTSTTDPNNPAPEGESIVLDGDFWFDTRDGGAIKVRKNGEWITIVSFAQQNTKYRVTFNLNADGDDAEFVNWNSEFPYIDVKEGQYYSANGNKQLPTAVRDGYIFGGWYTSDEPNLYISSTFTDLTPVFSNLTLYAYWIPRAQ